MNSSQFMDKQIMGLAGSQNNDFFELLSTPEEHNNGNKEDIVPSYDFQPIRPVGSGIVESNSGGGARIWNSTDSKANTSAIRSYASPEPHELAKVIPEKDRSSYDTATVAEIDRTMKKHADNLLHALEGVSAHLSLMESRTRLLESSVDDLKVSIGNNHGSTDGRMRQLENILREVQTGVQVLRDKQEIAEAQLQLARLQTSKGDQPTENPTPQTDSLQKTVSQPQQSLQPLLTSWSVSQPSALPTLPPPNAPPPPPQQTQSSRQQPTQLPQNQMSSIPPPLTQEQYVPPPGQLPDASSHQQYQMPTQQSHLQSQPLPPHQHYQTPAPQVPQYSQPPQLPPQQQQPPVPVNAATPQLQPPARHHPDENPCMLPPQSYPPTLRLPSSVSQPPSGSPTSQQFYAPPTHMYEHSGSRPSSGQSSFSAGYGPTPGPNFSDSYPYGRSPSHYGSSSMKQPPHSSPSAPSGGSSYSRLPTAQILPQAIPTASSVSSGSSPGGTGNRVPIDDVVDKVSTMGFSREQVRATVRKLTENGQSVDLNVVLDKLMNDGEIQPQKGWFGR